jgi:hypothetical protein
MDRRNPRGPAILAVLMLLTWLAWVTPAAAEWVAVTGDIGRTVQTATVHGGVQYANPAGSEFGKLDPGLGFEGGVAVHLIWNLSLDLSFALGSSDVDGQVVQLLDSTVREDGRSGTVLASADFTRARAGIRIDGLRQEGWRVQTYALAAVIFYTKTEVTVDQVGGSPLASGRASFDSSQFFNLRRLGALCRVGGEVELARHMGLDVAGNYEILEFPTGTASLTSVTIGFFYRI